MPISGSLYGLGTVSEKTSICGWLLNMAFGTRHPFLPEVVGSEVTGQLTVRQVIARWQRWFSSLRKRTDAVISPGSRLLLNRCRGQSTDAWQDSITLLDKIATSWDGVSGTTPIKVLCFHCTSR